MTENTGASQWDIEQDAKEAAARYGFTFKEKHMPETELRAAGTELLAQVDKLMPLIEKAIKQAWKDGDYVNGPQFGGAVERFRAETER
jgi:hypothetical protein